MLGHTLVSARQLIVLQKHSLHYVPIRHASLNSAIERGLRKSRNAEDFAPKRYRDNDRYDSRPRDTKLWNDRKEDRSDVERPGVRWSRKTDDSAPKRYHNNDRHSKTQRSSKPRKREEEETPTEADYFDEDEFIRTGLFPSVIRFRGGPTVSKVIENQRLRRKGPHKPTDQEPERVKMEVKPPDTIPYSSPASEFIYGTNAVEAAVRCGRRRMHVLYIYQAIDEELSPVKISLRKLAMSMGVRVKMAFGRWSELLDRMSGGRPHNGVVLEVSPLPQRPVTALRAVESISESYFRVDLGRQSREEADVNGTSNLIKINAQYRQRYPVILLLDGIVDTGNLGAIIRSAYFLGIDALVFAGRNSAPLNPVAMKASAGAAENMTLLTTSNEVAFIKQSKANGWRFYAADASGLGSTLVDPSSTFAANSEHAPNTLGQYPSVIMMGSESNGLSSHIKTHADSVVSIPGARHDPVLGVASDPARVDSLNVSVASALLMEMFLRIPIALSEVPAKKYY